MNSFAFLLLTCLFSVGCKTEASSKEGTPEHTACKAACNDKNSTCRSACDEPVACIRRCDEEGLRCVAKCGQ